MANTIFETMSGLLGESLAAMVVLVFVLKHFGYNTAVGTLKLIMKLGFNISK